jgi:pilin isopeptide linkage protein
VGQDLLNKVGTYHFKITELPGTSGGLHYDTSEYHFAITVTDNGNGALVASAPVIHKLGQATPVTSADFVNTYTVTGSGSVVIDGKKTLSGREIIAGEFAFGLYTDPNGEPVQVVTNRADGSFVFSPLNFTAADLDTGNGTKVYTYYVKEILPNGATLGVTYDTTVHTVTVTVSHNNAGALVVTPSGNHTGSIVINNVYNAEGVDVKLHGMKLLVGDWSAVQNKTFSFQLFEANGDYQVTSTTPVAVVTNSATGEFSFDLSFVDGQEGEHYYVLREDVSAAAGGVIYDATIYRVLVQVNDNGSGKLHAMVSMYHPGTGNVANDTTLGAPVAVFSNGYAADPTDEITISGNKVLTGRDLVAGEFEFVLKNEAGEIVEAVKNAADGSITFSTITFDKAGTYIYTVSEVKGTLKDVAYDETVFTVTVTVADDGAGKLVATVGYSAPVVFNNVYHEAPPKTADAFNPAIAAMMGVSAIGMLAVLILGKKKFEA